MKNIQIIDGATNCTFSLFQATDICPLAVLWIASSRSLSSGARSRDPLAPRNDG